MKDVTDHTTHITSTTYHQAELGKLADVCTHLDWEERKKLYLLLKKCEFIFNGTLGIYNTDPVDIVLNEYAPPHHAKPLPLLKAYKKLFKE